MKRFAFLIACVAPLGLAAVVHQSVEPNMADRVAELQQRIASGKTALKFEPRQGYLRSLLEELDISPESQRLVFSKTSLQSDFISPKTPRAMYFNEDTYVGWIPDAPVIEIMAVHPKQGVMFYTMPNEKRAATFTRETMECFRCHGGFRANQSPGFLSRSTYVGPSGYPRPFARTFDQKSDTPLKNRWGGWYVTGSHGSQRHMGNELAVGTDEKYSLNTESGANVTKLDRYVDMKPYLTPHSDIVALMVAEHQMDVQSVLSRVGLRVQNLLRRDAKEDEIASAVEPLVQALLCAGEVSLTAPIKGTSKFAEVYAASVPKDALGRSFSQLDLERRIYTYSFSPLVYSKSFDALPMQARTQVWKRLTALLSGSSDSVSLRKDERTAVLEILRSTKPEFDRFATTSGLLQR